MSEWLNGTALHRKPIQSHGASAAIWDHTVLPATQVNVSHLNHSQTNWYSICLHQRDERL